VIANKNAAISSTSAVKYLYVFSFAGYYFGHLVVFKEQQSAAAAARNSEQQIYIHLSAENELSEIILYPPCDHLLFVLTYGNANTRCSRQSTQNTRSQVSLGEVAAIHISMKQMAGR
jgi:hypothetical protein